MLFVQERMLANQKKLYLMVRIRYFLRTLNTLIKTYIVVKTKFWFFFSNWKLIASLIKESRKSILVNVKSYLKILFVDLINFWTFNQNSSSTTLNMIKEQIKQTVVAQYNNDWHSIVVYKHMQILKK